MKYLIIIIFLFLSNCSGYTLASISTNVVTVAATGKTNAALVVSYLAGKDCRFIRVTTNSEVCIQTDSNMAIKEETIEKTNTSDRKIVGRIIDTTYYITKNVTKDHAVLGAKIFDKIGLTNELEEKVRSKFENTEIEENLLQKPENNLKKETSISKKENREEKKNETTWKQRVEKVKVQKNELVEEVKVQKNELVEEVKVQKNELIEDAKIKSKTLIQEAKIRKKELIEKAKIQKKELVEKAREKSNELKESFLKNIKKFKVYSPDTYALNTDK